MALNETTAAFRADAERVRGCAGALLRRADDWADLFLEHTARRGVVLAQRASFGRAGPVRAQEAGGLVRGAGLRVCSGEQVLYASTEDLSEAGLGRLCDGLAEPGPVAGESLGVVETGAQRELRFLAQEAADAVFSLDARVTQAAISVRSVVRETQVVTADGSAPEQRSERTEIRVEVSYAGPRRSVTTHAVGGWNGAGSQGLLLRPDYVAAEAVERARVLSTARTGNTGEMPVVLAPGWGGVWLHECVGHLLEADVAAPGTLTAPAGITVMDDATLEGGRGSYGWDDEGTLAQRTVLIEHGRPCGLLTDRRQARLLGRPRTSNGRRQDYRYPPLPRMSNFFLLPGTTAPTDFIEEVKDGLYVAMIGGGTVYPAEDRYTFDVVEGYRIESGRLTSPVTGVRIEGRLSGALEQVAGIGSDLAFDHARGTCVKQGQAVPVSVGMPTVLLRGLEVLPQAV